eukprot:sb/3465183/
MITLQKLLGGIAAQVRVSGSAVQVLESPSQFADTLLQLSASATQRARISSLYFGSGKTEHQIAGNLTSSVRTRGCDVSVLLDHCRGLRNGAPALSNLRTVAPIHMFRPPHGFKIHNYRVPSLLGELLRVHHMKYYLFDDTVILSGANLSDLYFGPRQDRYITVESRELCDYLCEVHRQFCLYAPVWKNDALSWSWGKELVKEAAQTTRTVTSCNFQKSKLQMAKGDTSVFPMFQIPFYNIRQIDEALELICLRTGGKDLTLASGYFNPSFRLSAKLGGTEATVVVPSNTANGFHGGRGVKGFVPDWYNSIAVKFDQSSPKAKVVQYERDGWSFHGKGLWHKDVNILGSSNFNRRATARDNELSFALITENQNLKTALENERDRLLFYSTPLRREFRTFVKLGLPLMSSIL